MPFLHRQRLLKYRYLPMESGAEEVDEDEDYVAVPGTRIHVEYVDRSAIGPVSVATASWNLLSRALLSQGSTDLGLHSGSDSDVC